MSENAKKEKVKKEKVMKDFLGTKVPANYRKGAESLGGNLSFDETGMTFKSHVANIQRAEVRIEYE